MKTVNWLNLVLLLVALLLLAALAPLGIVFKLITCIRQGYFWGAIRYLFQFFGALARSIDLLGNVLCGDLFNAIGIKSGGYGFGKPDEYISYALGKNKQRNTLTDASRGLANLLNWLDTGHLEREVNRKEHPIIEP